jgi:hypothetical protein
MKVLPLFYLDSLIDDLTQQEQHACSDRLWLPQIEFERYMLAADTDSVVTLRLKNSAEQVTVGAVFAAHFGDADTIYAPLWMYEALELDTVDVSVERFFPLLGTSITIQPHTSDYLAMGDDPQETLKEGFEQYTCLSVGEDYKIWLGSFSFTITLQDIEPAETGVICIRNRELGLHILPPLDAPWPTPPAAAPAAPPSETAAVPSETAAVAVVAQLSAEERRRQIAEATRRRLGLSPFGS